MFFHLSAQGRDKSGLGFLTLPSQGKRLSWGGGEVVGGNAAGLSCSWGVGGVVGGNEAGLRCSHLLKASPGVGGSGNPRK